MTQKYFETIVNTLKHKTTAYEKGPLYYGLNFFNLLPNNLKTMESLSLFKTN